MNKINILFALLILSVVVYAGFGKSTNKVYECSYYVDRYIVADFSELVVSTCTDYEGRTSMCTETNSWSLEASKHNISKGSNIPLEIPKYPDPDQSFSKKRDFDRFRKVQDSNLHVLTKNGDQAVSFNEHINKTGKCLKMIGQDIVVKDWYGREYGSSFNSINIEMGD